MGKRQRASVRRKNCLPGDWLAELVVRGTPKPSRYCVDFQRYFPIQATVAARGSTPSIGARVRLAGILPGLNTPKALSQRSAQ
jgi:hypothetical protein